MGTIYFILPACRLCSLGLFVYLMLAVSYLFISEHTHNSFWMLYTIYSTIPPNVCVSERIAHFNIFSYQGHHKWELQIVRDQFVVFRLVWMFVFVFVSVYNHLHTSQGNTSDTSPKWGPIGAMIHHPVSSLTAKVMRKEPMQHWWGLAATNTWTMVLMADWRSDHCYEKACLQLWNVRKEEDARFVIFLTVKTHCNN